MKLINCTPHALTLRADEATETVIEPCGIVPRVSVMQGALDPSVCGAPCAVYSADGAGAVIGMPDPAVGVAYIVSGFVGAALKGQRDDVLVPGTGPLDGAVRNSAGHIVAVTRLKRV